MGATVLIHQMSTVVIVIFATFPPIAEKMIIAQLPLMAISAIGIVGVTVNNK